MRKMVYDAYIFAENAHVGQTRKWNGGEYFRHCVAVADLANDFMFKVPEYFPQVDEEEVIAAALLHDVVEDTDVTIEQISEKFGETVARYVYFLTKPEEYVGNREVRKALYRAQMALAPPEIKMVKFFDMLHNHSTIRDNDKAFWITWKDESIKMMIAMEVQNLYSGLLHIENKEFWLRLSEED